MVKIEVTLSIHKTNMDPGCLLGTLIKKIMVSYNRKKRLYSRQKEDNITTLKHFFQVFIIIHCQNTCGNGNTGARGWKDLLGRT